MKLSETNSSIKARREYQREWRAKNKDRIRGYNKRYWERRAERQKNEIKKDYDDSS